MTNEGWKVILGTSNVKRHYSFDKYPGYKPYQIKKCCNKETFKAESGIKKKKKNTAIPCEKY